MAKLGKLDRIKRRTDIDRAFRLGQSRGDGRMRLLVVANGLDRSRLAVAAGARHGKAVQRNRVKRLCREAFRLVRDELPGGLDYVIVPLAGRELDLAGLMASIRQLAPRLTRGPS